MTSGSLTFETVPSLPDSPGRGQKAQWPNEVLAYAKSVPTGTWVKVNGLHVKRAATLRKAGLTTRTRVGVVYVQAP